MYFFTITIASSAKKITIFNKKIKQHYEQNT